jgi:hypothetical protein
MVVLTLQSNKPVILVGPQAKPFKSIEATVKMADKTKYATAVIPNAKVTQVCLQSAPPSQILRPYCH